MNEKVLKVMEKNRPLLSDVTNEHVYHCAKCGLCLDACPVYREMLTESYSPRGKVQLAKHIIEGDIEITEHMSDILFRHAFFVDPVWLPVRAVSVRMSCFPVCAGAPRNVTDWVLQKICSFR